MECFWGLSHQLSLYALHSDPGQQLKSGDITEFFWNHFDNNFNPDNHAHCIFYVYVTNVFVTLSSYITLLLCLVVELMFIQITGCQPRAIRPPTHYYFVFIILNCPLSIVCCKVIIIIAFHYSLTSHSNKFYSEKMVNQKRTHTWTLQHTLISYIT